MMGMGGGRGGGATGTPSIRGGSSGFGSGSNNSFQAPQYRHPPPQTPRTQTTATIAPTDNYGSSGAGASTVVQTSNTHYQLHLGAELPPTAGFNYRVQLGNARGEWVEGVWQSQRMSSVTRVDVGGLPSLELSGLIASDFIDVVVAYAQSPEKVFCQLLDHSVTIQQISNKMEQLYGDGRGETLVNPRRGQICAARYSEDETFYRAAVINRINTQNVAVFFVDYGNIEVVHKTDLRIMSDELLGIPPQAIACKLHGVEAQTVAPSLFSSVAKQIEDREVVVRLQGTNGLSFLVTMVIVVGQKEVAINDVVNGVLAMPTLPSIGSAPPVPTVHTNITQPQITPQATASSFNSNQQSSSRGFGSNTTNQRDTASGRQQFINGTGGGAGFRSAAQDNDRQNAGGFGKSTGMLSAAYCCQSHKFPGMNASGRSNAISGVCRNCGEQGHFVRDCPKSRGGDLGNFGSNDSNMQRENPRSNFTRSSDERGAFGGISGTRFSTGFGSRGVRPESTISESARSQQGTANFVANGQPEDKVAPKATSPDAAPPSRDPVVGIMAEFAPAPTSTLRRTFVGARSDGGDGSINSFFVIPKDWESTLETVEVNPGRLNFDLPTDLKPGVCCIASYGDDEELQWYRAVVRKATANGAEVMFIDYGNAEEKAFKDVFKVDSGQPKEVIDVHRCAVECRFDYLQPTADCWTPSANEWFRDEALLDDSSGREVELVIAFMGKDDVLYLKDMRRVATSDQQDADGGDFSTVDGLIESGFAKRPTEHHFVAGERLTLGEQIQMVRSDGDNTTNFPIFYALPKCRLDAVEKVDRLCTEGATELLNPKVGDSCMVTCENSWYRAEIVSIDENVEGDIAVRMVDYGKIERKNRNEVFAITEGQPSAILKEPKNAVALQIAGVPVEPNSFELQRMAERFVDLLPCEKDFSMTILSYRDNIYTVELNIEGVENLLGELTNQTEISTTSTLHGVAAADSDNEVDLAELSKEIDAHNT